MLSRLHSRPGARFPFYSLHNLEDVRETGAERRGFRALCTMPTVCEKPYVRFLALTVSRLQPGAEKCPGLEGEYIPSRTRRRRSFSSWIRLRGYSVLQLPY